MLRRHALFIGLFVVLAATRFAIFFRSQTHVHSDEAIIGLMGKHILEGRHFPFYMYGQPYNAGAAWEAYLAAVAFALFGVGVLPLKSCVVVLSLLCLLLFYRMGCALYRPAHGRFRNHRVCLGSVASEMAFPSERLFLVLSFNPRPYAALCIDRIGLGSEAKDIITLRSCVWPEHLVSGVDDPGGRGVVAAAYLATQDLAQ